MFLFCSLCRIGTTWIGTWPSNAIVKCLHGSWDLAIKRNSEALKGIIEALFAMLGLDGRSTVARMPQPPHRAVLRVLRPAESAVRRLIVVAARGLVVKVAPSRPMPKGHRIGKGGGTFALPPSSSSIRAYFSRICASRRVKYAKHPPRIHFFEPIP